MEEITTSEITPERQLSDTDIVYNPPFVVNQFNPPRSLSQTIGWGLNKLGIDKIHASGITGKGIKVAVLDTIVLPTHPDLVGGIVKSLNATTEPLTTPVGGHGTAVAGIIGARNNTSGMLGYAPECDIIAIKVMTESGAGAIGDIIKGIDMAIAEGVNIINMSLGTSYDYPGMKSAVQRATDAGIFVVCAAGNDGLSDSVNYPGRYEASYCVAATRESGNVSAFSSMGDSIDVAAPGESILCPWKDNGYVIISGTSMAAPAVSGILALLLHAKLEINHQNLYDTCIDLETPGFDSKSGYGLINPNAYITRYTVPTTPSDNWPQIRDAVRILNEGLKSNADAKKLLEDFLAGIQMI